MYYDELLQSLNQRGIAYLIVGGLAVNLHGVPRSTQDIDLIISTDRDNVMGLVEVLTGLGYRPRMPVDPCDLADPVRVDEWIREKYMKAFSFYHATENYRVVDIVLVHPLDFTRAYERRTRIPYRSFELPTTSIDDLIVMKEFSGRPQDLSDIEMLRVAKRIGEEDDA